MARIVSIGAALQDVFLIDSDDFGTNKRGYFNQLELGSKVDIDKIHFSTGGGATNAATTFARYGHESIFMGCISEDPAGQAIIDVLDREGIDASYVTYTDKVHTGYSVVLLTPTGERTILTCRGASAQFNTLKAKDLEKIHPDWIYVTNMRGDMNKLDDFFTVAHKNGIKVMFNPGSLELQNKRQLIGLLADVDVLLVNKKEAKQIVVGSTLNEVASRLHDIIPTTIVTDGANGAIAYSADEAYRIGLYEDPPIVDSTGAGDAFGSGFLAAYAAGKSFKDSLIFASANSTSVIQKIGSKSGILTNRTKLHNMPMEEIL
jgi:ribokinase